MEDRNYDALAAEKAAIEGYQNRRRNGRRVRVLGIDVTNIMDKYLPGRTPGFDASVMFSRPQEILIDAKPEAVYLWRKPEDNYTRNFVARGVMKPVLMERVNMQSAYANVAPAKIITSRGPREVVRSPGGLGLFEVPSMAALKELDKQMLPGEHHAHRYLADLANEGDRFASEVETLSTPEHRVHGEITTSETRMEPIV